MNKLLVWGTGAISDQVIKNGLNGNIIGFIETNKRAETYCNKKVFSVEEIPNEYDYIIVANSFVKEIYDACIKNRLNLNKFIFLKGIKIREGMLDLNIINEILGEKNYTDYCNEFGIYEQTFFDKDIEEYKKLNARENFRIQEKYLWPILIDKYSLAGTMGNYFWQDLWAAKIIYRSGVKTHFDIGSRIDGFIAHLLAMDIEVSLIDIREFPGEVERLHTIVDDATQLTQIPNGSIESMSALCSLEHFGLGRYGDSIDPEACFKCFREIQKKIKTNGNLYISVPVGKERLEFNAHRVFYSQTIIESFSSMKLKEFSCVSEGKIERNVAIHKYDQDEHNGEYRYGLFHFIKP